MKPRPSTLLTLLVAALLATGAAHAAGPELVANGSFEQGPGGLGSFAGWQTRLGDAASFVDSTGSTGTLFGQATDGLWSAWFGSSAASGGATIRQTLATVAGRSYRLGFDLANDNGGAGAENRFAVQVGGTTLLTLAGIGAQGYAHRELGFVAAGGTTLIGFDAFNDNGWLELDNVSVTAVAAPVPEPASLGMLGAGLVALLVAVGRRRHASRGAG